MVGDLQAGDADDLSGCVANYIHSVFVQVLKLDVGEVIGHFLASAQAKWREAVARGNGADLKRHLNFACIKVKGRADLF